MSEKEAKKKVVPEITNANKSNSNSKNQNSNETKLEISNETKNLILLVHLLSIFIGFISPLIFLLSSKEEIVKQHSKVSLNWQISYMIYIIGFGIVTFILSIVTFGFFAIIGIPLFFLIGLVAYILPIVATIKASNDPQKIWNYPGTIKFIQ